MDPDDNGAVEQAILAVLTGTPLAEAAAQVRSTADLLAEAAVRYRTAGRAAAFDVQPELSQWHQLNIEFTDYPTAERTFCACLLPLLRQETETEALVTWWFVRKYPCWRLRVVPGPATTIEGVTKPISKALDNSVLRGETTRWWPSPYEPETTAFGGPIGMDIAHDLFHTDSVGVLGYLNRNGMDNRVLDAKAVSVLAVSLFLRAAGQEWGEQGDVWARVEAARPLPDDVPVERVTAMTDRMHRLLTIDAIPALAADGPLSPVVVWIAGFERGGRALGHSGREGLLTLGTRSILARHILFHWNRMGFTTRQQAIWARAARRAILDN